MGNSDTYITVATRSSSGVGFYAVGDTWQEGTVEVGSATVTLKLLGGDADIDNFLKETRSNKLDLRGTVVNDKVLAVKEYFLDCFYYGTTHDVKAFAGLHELMTSTTYNTIHEGSASTGTQANVDSLRQAIDLIRFGRSPDLIVMSRTNRRRLAAYYDSIGDKMPGVIDKFGKMVSSFDGIPIDPSDHIVNVEAVAGTAFSDNTGGTTSSVFILSFDPIACCGVQGPSGLTTKPLGDLETKDAERVRIRWPVGLMFKHLRSCAKIDGMLTNTVWVA